MLVHIHTLPIQNYMLAMIRERRISETKEERYDLFSALLDANDLEVEEGEKKLLDSELIGNLFIFLLAGEHKHPSTRVFRSFNRHS